MFTFRKRLAQMIWLAAWWCNVSLAWRLCEDQAPSDQRKSKLPHRERRVTVDVGSWQALYGRGYRCVVGVDNLPYDNPGVIEGYVLAFFRVEFGLSGPPAGVMVVPSNWK